MGCESISSIVCATSSSDLGLENARFAQSGHKDYNISHTRSLRSLCYRYSANTVSWYLYLFMYLFERKQERTSTNQVGEWQGRGRGSCRLPAEHGS